MDRSHELEIIRRSIAMLTPGQQALRREEALDLIEELKEVSDRLGRLRRGLVELVEADDAVARHPAAGARGRDEGPGPRRRGRAGVNRGADSPGPGPIAT